MKTKKIIKVLKHIQETCKSHQYDTACFDCPYGTGTGSCTITSEYNSHGLILPEEWNIEAVEEKFKYIERI